MLRSIVVEVNSFEQWACFCQASCVDNNNFGLMEVFNDVRKE